MDGKYLGNWDSYEEMLEDFFPEWDFGPNKHPMPEDLPTDEEIIVASYDTPSYEGYAFVLFEKDGKLFEVNGSHCSCYGLEGQFIPEETSWEALALRPEMPFEIEYARCGEAVKELIAEHGLKVTWK